MGEIELSAPCALVDFGCPHPDISPPITGTQPTDTSPVVEFRVFLGTWEIAGDTALRLGEQGTISITAEFIRVLADSSDVAIADAKSDDELILLGSRALADLQSVTLPLAGPTDRERLIELGRPTTWTWIIDGNTEGSHTLVATILVVDANSPFITVGEQQLAVYVGGRSFPARLWLLVRQEWKWLIPLIVGPPASLELGSRLLRLMRSRFRPPPHPPTDSGYL